MLKLAILGIVGKDHLADFSVLFHCLSLLGGITLGLHTSLKEAGRDGLLGLEMHHYLIEFGLLNPDPCGKLTMPPFKRRGGLDQAIFYLLEAVPLD